MTILVITCVPAIACAASALAPCQDVAPGIQAGNAAALALFARRVVDRAAVGTAPRPRRRDFGSAEAQGARGDGVTDDTPALQRALDRTGRVWLKAGRVYRITHRLTMRSGSALVSDGSATILMASGPGGFNNRVALRDDDGLYNERATGLRLMGADITLNDLFVVKEYEDDRYVIGIEVRESSRVTISRIRLRGFSLAPGIVTVRSSDDVEISGSLIHASCTRSVDLPHDVAAFQITGISVDDSRVGGRGSTGLRLLDNVIADLRMEPMTARGDQSDGINFAGVGTGSGSLISGNDISGVDEGIDLFGAGIDVVGNRVAAESLSLKLIHGARAISVRDNEFMPGPRGRAIGIFRAQPAEARRQVQDIQIEGNRVNIVSDQRIGVHVDAEGAYPPASIALRRNLFVVGDCRMPTIACSPSQCSQNDNGRVQAAAGIACSN